MSGFSSDWLALREPLDAAARDAGLARGFATALAGSACRVIDLGAGTGANFRLLAPQIEADQDWLLLDHDPALLTAQRAAIIRWAQHHGWRIHEGDEGNDDDADSGLVVATGQWRWRVRSQQIDLQRSLEQLDLDACDGVTTTAFLDLVSAEWIERLCTQLADAARPLLATLTVDGRREWHPPLEDDARLHQAFLQHQAGDKGFGPALGIAAVDEIASRLAARRFVVSTARSDWQIGPERAALLQQMIDEAAAVAAETAPARALAEQQRQASSVAAWAARRHAQVSSGALSLTVGHRDLLAVPGPGA
jgi:hypothetical protein